jgi:glycosyltransferase involved in cell wall biosynthesis
LRTSQGLDVRLAVYSAPEQIAAYRTALEAPGVTELKGWLPPDRLPEAFHAADVLVHVESFTPTIAEYTKLSFSTKLSQYMMAGRCILAIGPERLGSLRLVRDIPAGVVLHEASAAALQAPLATLVKEVAERAALGRRGRAWAEQYVQRNTAHGRFRRELLATVERHASRKGLTPLAA